MAAMKVIVEKRERIRMYIRRKVIRVESIVLISSSVSLRTTIQRQHLFIIHIHTPANTSDITPINLHNTQAEIMKSSTIITSSILAGALVASAAPIAAPSTQEAALAAASAPQAIRNANIVVERTQNSACKEENIFVEREVDAEMEELEKRDQKSDGVNYCTVM